MKRYLQRIIWLDGGPLDAWAYILKTLDNRIKMLKWDRPNYLMCGFSIGAIVATIIWFAIWYAT